MNKPRINEYIGQYGSADADSKAYIDAMNMFNRNNNISDSYSMTTSESQQFLSHYHKKNSSSNNSSSQYKIGNISKIQDLGSSVLSSNMGSEFIQPSQIINGVIESLQTLTSKDGPTKMFENMFKDIANLAFEGIADIQTKETELRNELNSRIGVSGELSRAFRTELIDSLPVITRMGYSFDDVKETILGMVEAQGNFAFYNRDIIDKMVVSSRAFIGNMRDTQTMIINYQKVGFGAGDAFDKINEAGENSLFLGLNARRTTEEIGKNIDKLNQFGFKNGYDGLSRMVQKSIEFKFNMNSVFTLADRLFDPEAAVSLSAELQAIGGVIGDFNDPLKMLYMATNDVGGLADSMALVAGSVATYNTEMNKFEISGANLRRARALAKELGMDYKEFSELAVKSAERANAATEIMSRGFDINDEQKEFLLNLSRMEGGKMVIDIPESVSSKFGNATRIALSEITEEQKNLLIENQKEFDKMSAKDIAEAQYTETQNMGLRISAIYSLLKTQFAGAVRQTGSEIDEYIKEANRALDRSLLENVPEVDRKIYMDKISPMKVDNKESKTTTKKNNVEGTLNVNHHHTATNYADIFARNFEKQGRLNEYGSFTTSLTDGTWFKKQFG